MVAVQDRALNPTDSSVICTENGLQNTDYGNRAHFMDVGVNSMESVCYKMKKESSRPLGGSQGIIASFKDDQNV
jgi:hypothetical protein